MSSNRRFCSKRKTSPADTPPSHTFSSSPPFRQTVFTEHLRSQTEPPNRARIPCSSPPPSPPLQSKPQQVGVTTGRSAKRAGQSRGGPCYATLLSAGGCGDGLLELLAADLAGAGLEEQVVAGVADQHRVIQLLVWDGQLQVTTVFTEHIATVPEDEDHKGS